MNVDEIADLERVRNLRDAFIANFADVNEPFDARRQLDERAERHQVRNATANFVAFDERFVDLLPRIAARVFVRERNAVPFEVDFSNDNVDAFAFFDDFGRVGDAAPAHLGDREETVDAAEIDERADVDDLADKTVASLTDGEFRHRLFAHFFAFAFHQDAAADHQVAAFRIDFGNDALPAFADELLGVFDEERRDLTVRHKAAEPPDFAFEPAFVGAGNARFDDRPDGKTEPVADFRRGQRKRNFVNAVFGVEAGDDRVKFLADRRLSVFRELFQRNKAVFAPADVDENGVALDGFDAATDFRSLFERRGADVRFVVFHQRVERFAVQERVKFVFEVVRKTGATIRRRNGRERAARRGDRTFAAFVVFFAVFTVAIFAVAAAFVFVADRAERRRTTRRAFAGVRGGAFDAFFDNVRVDDRGVRVHRFVGGERGRRGGVGGLLGLLDGFDRGRGLFGVEILLVVLHF